MAKEINTLIKSLLEVQQRREDNQIIKLPNVRVVSAGRQYYAKVVISAEAVIIQADDLEIDDLHFRQVHLRGFHEVEQKGILLNLYNRQQVVLHFRTERQMARVLRRIRQLTGSESTSESSSCEETSECSSALTSN